MHPTLARTFFRLQERLFRRPSFRILSELTASERWDPARRDELRRARLRALVASAYEHVPYWTRLMDERGITPDDIRSLEDIRRFPLMDKTPLRADREAMTWKAEGPRLQRVRTSGSTNEALEFYTNSNREAQINAARMRGHRWIGLEKGEKELYYWGSPVELSKQDKLKVFRDRLINDALTNGFVVNPQRVRESFKQWMAWGPKCIFGYPSTFTLTVQIAGKEGLDLTQLRSRGLEMICTTSEMLGPVNRRIIAEGFGVPVYDSYGLREVGLIGHECAEQTLHTMDEQLLLETVDPDTGEVTDGEGELVATNLVCNVTPIIRYRTGDVVKLSDEPCACGRTLGRVEISGGRVADFAVAADGTSHAGYTFIYIARSVKGIVKFQARQSEVGKIKLLLVVDDEFTDTGPAEVVRQAKQRLGEDTQIDVELVDDIEPAPSGKYRPVINTIGE